MIRRTPPEVLLALVVAAVYLNQLGFTLYVLAVHDGDPGFVAQYLPAGWFELWTPPFLVEQAARLPQPELLAPTVLHVQAFWELPFVLLAYLAVLRWLSPGAYRRIGTSWVLWAASAVWTVVFCVIEALLASPWTAVDVVVRAVSGVVTPWAVLALARREPCGTPDPRPTAARLLAFGASTALFGYLVLVVYDTALLYNLGRLPERLPAALVALVLLIGLRVALGSRSRSRSRSGAGSRTATHAVAPIDVPGPPGAGPVLALVAACLRHGLVLFFVPALAIRYVLSYFGGLWAGLVLVLVIVVLAGALAARETLHGLPRRAAGRVAAASVAALAVGCALGAAAAAVGPVTYVEEALGRGAVVAFVGVIAAGALADRCGPIGAGARR